MTRPQNANAGRYGRRGQRRSHRLRLVATVVPVAIFAACYRTSELPPRGPEPGTRIVAGLTPAGAASMQDLIGVGASGIEARVLEARPQEWELAVLSVTHSGPAANWRGERVVFRRDVLVNVRQRRLDGVRSAALTAGVTAVLFVLARSFSTGGAADSRGPPPSPVE
jgi:hypothetical protein